MHKSIQLKDGSHFLGEFHPNGKRDGMGIKTYPNGATYQGFYKGDVRDGIGVKTTQAGVQKAVRYSKGTLIK